MIKYLAISFLLFSGLSCQIQKSAEVEDTIDKEAHKVIDPFLSDLKKSEINTSLNRLFDNSIRFNDSAVTNLQQKFITIHQNSGKYQEGKLIKKKKLGNDIAAYSYLIKYERKFYRLIFIFYNNGKSIELYKFSFDDNIDIELEESLKYYLD